VLHQRNLLYTAVTRGKRLVVLIAQPRALGMAVKQTGGGRLTKLRERLAGGMMATGDFSEEGTGWT
jgi:exodeoxyribonuclease V alpha subunit